MRERFGAARGESLDYERDDRGRDDTGRDDTGRDDTLRDDEIEAGMARKSAEFVDLGATVYVREPARR